MLGLECSQASSCELSKSILSVPTLAKDRKRFHVGGGSNNFLVGVLHTDVWSLLQARIGRTRLFHRYRTETGSHIIRNIWI
jgi:hypothetical protein